MDPLAPMRGKRLGRAGRECTLVGYAWEAAEDGSPAGKPGRHRFDSNSGRPGGSADKGTLMSSAQGFGEGSDRWAMLAVISLGIFALTLNWFDVATALPLIGAEFKVGLGPLSLLISLYIVGYGLSHIPGGMLSTSIGMKKTLVLGLLVQGLAGIMSGLSYSYNELAFFRVVSGIGGSVFVAMTAAAMVVLVRRKGGDVRPRRHRRRCLQCGSGVRPLRLVVPATGDRLACLAGSRRCLRAPRRRRHDRGVPDPRRGSVARWREVRPRRIARLDHEQRSLDLWHRLTRRIWRLLHHVATLQ